MHLLARIYREDGTVVAFRVTMNPIKCVCSVFEQTGKYCLHLLAVRLLLSNGPADDWKGTLSSIASVISPGSLCSDIEYRIEKEFTGATHLVKLHTGRTPRGRSDDAVEKEFDRLMKKIAARDAKEADAALAAEDHLFDRPGGKRELDHRG